MPTVGVETSVAANSTNSNVFDGQRAAKIPNISGASFQVTYLSTSSATGLTEELFVGAANPVESSPVSLQNRIPISPDDIVTTFMANPGEEVTVRVANSTVGALTHFAKLVVTRVR